MKKNPSKIIFFTATGITIILAMIVIIGWYLENNLLTSIFPGQVDMKFNTAVGFLLASLAILLFYFSAKNKSLYKIACFLSLSVAAIGLLTLLEYIFDFNPGIDEFFVMDPMGNSAGNFAGRMSPITALNYILIGSGMLLFNKEKTALYQFYYLFFIAFLGGLMLIGFNFIFEIPSFIRLAFPTALCFILLPAAIYYSQPFLSKRISFENKLYTSFVAVMVLIIIVSVVSGIYSQKRSTATLLMEDKNNVVMDIERTFLLLEEIENTTNGYILTGDSSYLGSFNYAKENIFNNIKKLKELTADNNNSQMIIDSLQYFFEKKINFSEKCIEAKKENGIEAAGKLIKSFEGIRYKDNIRNLTSKIASEEKKLYNQQHNEIINSSEAFNRVFFIFLGSVFGLFIVIFFSIRNNFAFRRTSYEHFANENRFKKAEKVAHFGIWESDIVKNITKWSDGTYRIFGYEPGEVIPSEESFLNCLHPDDRERIRRIAGAASLSLEITRMQFRVKDKNGSIRYVESEFLVERDNKEVPLKITGFNKDITEQKKAEEEKKKANDELQEKAKFIHEISDNIPGGIFQMIHYKDGTSKMNYVSEYFEELWGISVTEAMDEAVEKYLTIHQDDLERILNEITECVKCRCKKSYKYRNVNRKTGKVTWVRTNSVSRELPDGSVLRTGVVIDINDSQTYYEQLEEANKRYEYVSMAVHESIWELDLKTMMVIFGGGYKDRFGIEFPGNTITFDGLIDTIHPDDSKNVRDTLLAVINDPSKRRWEAYFRTLKSDGTIRNSFARAIIIYDDITNKPTKVIGSTQDITEQVKTETDLKKSLKETMDYKYAIDESSIISITDANGIIIHVNDNFCKISQYSRDELLGQNHRIVNSGYHPKELFKDLWDNVSRGNIWRNEVKSKSKDGTFYWADTTIVPFLNENGKPYQHVAIRKNITARKIAEEQLMKSEHRFRKFFENAPEAVIILDIEKLIFVDFNDNALRLLKTKREDLLYSSPLKVTVAMQPEGISAREKMVTNIKRIVLGETFATEWLIVDSKGSEIFCEIRASMLSEFDKNLMRLSVIDITDRNNAEKERKAITEDLFNRNKDLEQFTYIVSHNLRAPIANILGFSEELKSQDLSEEEEINLRNELHESVKHLDSVILDLNDILDVRATIKEKREEVFFSNIVHFIKSEIKNLIENNEVEIVTNFSDAPAIETIKSYMHSIFYNLISNSIKYKQPGKKPVIEINSYKKDGKIILTFKDNGMGINLTANKNSIFGLYKRFHRNIDGKGLGLFMIKSQITALGGNISVESEINKGTTFTIVLNI